MANPSLAQPSKRRHKIRLSVRALLLLVLLIGGGLGWVVNRAQVQREAVAVIEAAGGRVGYDLPSHPQFEPVSTADRCRLWLADRLGQDVVGTVTDVYLDTSDAVTNIKTFEKADTVLVQIGRLSHVDRLEFDGCTGVNDAGLAHLSALTRVRWLSLQYTGVRGRGLAHLKAMRRLDELGLGDLPVSDADLAPLAGLVSLNAYQAALGGRSFALQAPQATTDCPACSAPTTLGPAKPGNRQDDSGPDRGLHFFVKFPLLSLYCEVRLGPCSFLSPYWPLEISPMRPISPRRVNTFIDGHPDSESSLRTWFKVVKKALWSNFAEVKADFPSASIVGNCVVFNISGNKYRLISKIVYANGEFKGRLYIKEILPHKEYDTGKWKHDCGCI
jgi:mRNA interferase HigB